MHPGAQDVEGVIAQARAAPLHNRGTFGYSNLGIALLVVTWHTGAAGGFASMLGLDRINDRAVVILANTSEAAAHDAGMMLLVGERP